MTYPDGLIYEGMWADGQKNGEGVATYPNGTVYKGSFKDDKRDGQGV